MMFYVTAIDGGRVHLLAGPYDTKEAAESMVKPVQDFACDHARNASAGRAWFMAYGVSRWKDESRPPAASRLGVATAESLA